MNIRKAAIAAALAAFGNVAAAVQAQDQTTYSLHQPHWHIPHTLQMVRNQCGTAGYTRQTYLGRTTCIRCQSGYFYAKFNGADRCVRCMPTYSYATNVSGRNLCVRCPAGYVFTASGGRNFCLRRK